MDNDKKFSLPSIREIVIATFFIGGYVMQFQYMNAQLNYLATIVDQLQIQVASQGAKLDSAIDQLQWMRERWK